MPAKNGSLVAAKDIEKGAKIRTEKTGEGVKDAVTR
jgi:hypothetical protein